MGFRVFSCSKQLYRQLCLPVCNTFLPCFDHWIFMKLSLGFGLMECLWLVLFQVKRSKANVFVWPALWFCTYFTDMLYTLHKYSPWHDDVSQSISRSKVQGQGHSGYLKWRSHRSFEVFVVSALWLPPYWTESLHIWHAHNIWGGNMARTIFRTKGQRLRSHRLFKVWPCPFHGVIPIWPNQFILYVANIHHMRGWVMCHAPSSRWKVKGQGHMGHLNFLLCLFCGVLLIWWNHFICGLHTTPQGLMWKTLFSE